jgi:hypothetical protein
MYTFAAVMLLGLAICKLVDLVMGFAMLSRLSRVLVAMLFGVAVAWGANYDAFAGWGVTFRDSWYGIVGTGFALAGVAGLWHEIAGLLTSYGRRVHDQATETRIPRAA